MDVAHEIRYVRNELAKIREIVKSQEENTKEALLTLTVDICDNLKALTAEIKLSRQTYVLMSLSDMSKTKRKTFLKIADFIQREDDFIDAFGGVGEDIIDIKKLKRTL